MGDLLTTKELATYLKVHPYTIYRWRKEGLPCIGAKSIKRYDAQEVIDWMKYNRK